MSSPGDMANSVLIVFFDGHCGLCNRTVDWLIRRDHQRILRFASLQGAYARQQLPDSYINPGSDQGTLVFLQKGCIFDQSTAAIMIVASLGGVWSIARVLLWIPCGIRDAIYRWVATHRTKWFGRTEQCRLPLPHEKEFFLD